MGFQGTYLRALYFLPTEAYHEIYRALSGGSWTARPGAMLEIHNDFLPGQYFVLSTGKDYFLHVGVSLKMSVPCV